MAEERVDVLIIGSGHSGGMAAKILTEKGISCLMLNAGPVADAHKDAEPKPAYALPFRGFSQPGRLPQYPDGNFVPDESPWTGCMQRFIAAGKRMGVPVCKPRSSLGVDGLASSVNLLLPDAFATGKLKAIPNVVVRELSVDRNTGLVNEAHFVDRISRREMSVKARVVVLAAGTLESTRLLLNSKLANSSGVMGHYLVDQVYGPGIVCSVPEARDGKATPELIGGGALVPRFRNIDSKAKNFIRGYA